MAKRALPRIRDTKLRTRHQATVDECADIWEHQLLQHYTRHGADHSERIVERLSELAPASLLSDIELYILLQAVYLHDIGMQDIAYACPDRNRANLTPEDYELIRKKHHLASEKWIMEDAAGTSQRHTLKLRGDLYADLIALVSRHHTDSDLSSVSVKVERAGETIRPRLLAALLTIADELDLDARRVNMETLIHQPIPQLSKEHWWRHHYVERCHVVDQHVEIVLEVPQQYRGIRARSIARSVARPIRKQLAKIYLIGALRDAGIEIKINDPQIVYDDVGRKQLLPLDVHFSPTDVLREDDISALQAYSTDDIVANPSTHFYGFNPLTMTAAEIKQLIGFYQQTLLLTASLGKLKTDVLNRQLREQLSVLLTNDLTPQARLFLYQRAGLMLANQMQRRLLPNLGEPAETPGELTDHDVWEWFRRGDGRLLCAEPGEYERWRGAVELSLAQCPDIVASIDACVRDLTSRFAVMLVSTNTMTSLDDPGTLEAVRWLTQLNPEVEAELTRLHTQEAQVQTPMFLPGTLIVTVAVEGQPVAGGQVDISTVEHRPVTVAKLPTDDAGQVTVPLAGNTTYQISVHFPSGLSTDPLHGILSRSVHVHVPAEQTTELPITLYRITGRVLDQQGQPLTGARVKLTTCVRLLHAGPYYGPYATYVWTVTDTSGFFSLVVAPGIWSLECSYQGNVWNNEVTIETESVHVPDILLAVQR